MQLLSRFAPAIFVVLWSTGWVTARFATDYAGPVTFLSVRFMLSAALMLVICLALKVPIPTRPMDILHGIIAGAFMQGLYLGLIWWAIGEGVPASIGGIIAGLQPLLTGCAAYLFLKERLSAIQVAGLIIGFLGIFLAVLPKALALSDEASTIPLYAVLVNMLGMVAIAYGTIYQKQNVHSVHVMASVFLQYIGGTIVVLPYAIYAENFRYAITLGSSLAMVWAVGAISIGAVAMLLMLINRGQAARAASLIYLVPPLAAIEAAVLFGDQLSLPMIIGTVIAVLGVYLTNRRSQ